MYKGSKLVDSAHITMGRVKVEEKWGPSFVAIGMGL